MNRLLFVDDEENILNGIKRMLRPMKDEWEAHFCTGGEQALKLMQEKPFDIVISDMMMPEMNGIDFLKHVRQQYPNAIRISLTGHMDNHLAEQNTMISHQQLAKPCSAETLKNTLQTSLQLKKTLSDENVASVISQITSLPSLPKTYQEIVAELQSEDASIENVGNIIESDTAMTSKILQLVNSAFFGLPRTVTKPSDAATYLGMDVIKGLVLSVGIFSQFEDNEIPEEVLERLQQAGLQISAISHFIGKQEKLDKEVLDNAQIAGLVIYIGILVLCSNMPKEYKRIMEMTEDDKIPYREAEQMVLGCSHTDIATYLLGLWGLPQTIIEAVNYYRQPSLLNNHEATTLTLLHIANAFYHKIHNDTKLEENLDDKYLQQTQHKGNLDTLLDDYLLSIRN